VSHITRQTAEDEEKRTKNLPLYKGCYHFLLCYSFVSKDTRFLFLHADKGRQAS